MEIFSFSDFEANFGGFYLSSAIDSNVAHAVNEFFLNGGSVAYVVGLKPALYSDSDGSNQTPGSSLGPVIKATSGPSGLSGIAFTALEPTDLQTISVTINNLQTTTNSNDTADITIAYGTQTETYRRVLISATDPTVLNNRINGVSALVMVAPQVTPNYPNSFTVGNATLSAPPPSSAVGVFNASDFETVFAADSLLDKLPIFNLMLIPGIVNNSVLSQAIAFCERKQAFLIMDPPRDDQADRSGEKLDWRFRPELGDQPEGNIALSEPERRSLFSLSQDDRSAVGTAPQPSSERIRRRRLCKH